VQWDTSLQPPPQTTLHGTATTATSRCIKTYRYNCILDGSVQVVLRRFLHLHQHEGAYLARRVPGVRVRLGLRLDCRMIGVGTT